MHIYTGIQKIIKLLRKTEIWKCISHSFPVKLNSLNIQQRKNDLAELTEVTSKNQSDDSLNCMTKLKLRRGLILFYFRNCILR